MRVEARVCLQIGKVALKEKVSCAGEAKLSVLRPSPGMVSALNSSVFPSSYSCLNLLLSTRVYIFDPSFLSLLTLLCASYITFRDITWLLQFHWTATNSGRQNENRATVTRRIFPSPPPPPILTHMCTRKKTAGLQD